MKYSKTIPDNILLDYSLLINYKNTKKFIPFFLDKNNIYVFTTNTQTLCFENLIFYQKNVGFEFFSEKLQLVNNYEKWLNDRFFDKHVPIRCIVDFILIESLNKNASDIHFDILDFNQYVVKFKVKTLLVNFCSLNKEQYDSVLIAFKILSSLDTSKRLSAQSSSFYKIYKDECIDFRFSTHPTCLGERFVIRILYKKNIINYSDMNLIKSVEDDIEKIINCPNGLILFTGPTNSGKTTLIHSILSNIVKQNVSIMTLEDPVEYKIPGIIQSNVSDNGFTFFDGMKSILRQDPDVIFLGEIRDEKTARIAVQAALTGHKVLTTLHAYSIKGAITRLIDFGISNFLLSESLSCVLNQRLLRKKDNADLILLADSCFINDQLKDCIKNNNSSVFKDKLRENADVYLKQNLIDQEEIKRIFGL